MSHCIHAIVSQIATADTLNTEWPELPRLNQGNGVAIFPVDASSIDKRIAPDVTPTVTGDEFMLLTNGFREQLRALSIGGLLAYVETEYFGGVGGQGALVCRDGVEIMPPTWSEAGVINEALKLLGIKRGHAVDEFDAVGFAAVRSNDDLLDQIAVRVPRRDLQS